ncbi:MAG TPA: TolC family protein [Casimicrobiaceae bacterium]|nr:TolC family protein [Casimicrobiaceae bacterium]
MHTLTRSVVCRATPWLVALAHVATAVAQVQAPLTLGEALRIAETRAPGLSAADAAARGARELAVASGQLPDPILRAGIDNLPVSGSDAFSLTRDFMTMRRIGIMQEYVSTDKRNARRSRGEREAERLEAEGQVLRAEMRADVASAWYDRLYATQTEALLKALADETAMQQRATEAQVASGRASAADALSARVSLALANDRITAAQRQQRVATARLARWLREDAERPPAGDFGVRGDADVAAAPTFEPNGIPQLAVLTSQIDVADAALKVSELDRNHNWSWEVSFGHREPNFSNMLSVGVSVPLPIAREYRQDREVAARIAQRDHARELLEDARRRYRAMYDTTRIEWQAVLDRRRDLESTLLPAVAQRIDATLAAYQGGQQNLAAVLEARRAAVDARLQILDLEREAAKLHAQLRYLYGNAEGGKR